MQTRGKQTVKPEELIQLKISEETDTQTIWS